MVSHESKSSALLRIFVLGYVDIAYLNTVTLYQEQGLQLTHLAILFEQVLEILIGSPVRQVVNFQGDHPKSHAMKVQIGYTIISHPPSKTSQFEFESTAR